MFGPFQPPSPYTGSRRPVALALHSYANRVNVGVMRQEKQKDEQTKTKQKKQMCISLSVFAFASVPTRIATRIRR